MGLSVRALRTTPRPPTLGPHDVVGQSVIIYEIAMSLRWRTLILTAGVVIPLYIGFDWLLVRAGVFPAIKWRGVLIGAMIFAVGSYWRARRTTGAPAGIAPAVDG